MLNFAPAMPSRNDLDWCWYLRRQGPVGEAVERVLHDIGVMYHSGWADWGPSRLTTSGAPVEVTFSTAGSGMSVTTEVANPGSDAGTRVAQTCRIIKDLGCTPPPPALRDVISAAQSEGDLAFGAWLGLEQTPQKLNTKLYAELPACSTDLSQLASGIELSPVLSSLDGQTTVTMLGYDCATGEVTTYFKTTQASLRDLPVLAEPAGVSPDMLCSVIDSVLDQAPQLALPSDTLRFSYRAVGKGKPPVLALYFPAGDLFASDVAAMRRLRHCRNGTMAGYLPLIDHLSLTTQSPVHHGMIGLTARPNAGPIVSIGVNAPWSDQSATQ